MYNVHAKIVENIAFDIVCEGQKRKKAYVYRFCSNFLSKFISYTTERYKLSAPTVFYWSSNSRGTVLIPFLLLKYYIAEAETAEKLSSFLFSYNSIILLKQKQQRSCPHSFSLIKVLQWAPKVYIARKVYIVFPPPPFFHPNINLFEFFFSIFSKYSPFLTIPQIFSPLPIFLGFF